MHSDQYPYLKLHDEMARVGGSSDFVMFAKWLRDYPEESAWLQSVRARSPETPFAQEDLWRLYAVSRVFEVLALPFQQGDADRSGWNGPGFPVAHFKSFAEALGMRAMVPRQFAPFDCEVVGAANTALPNDPIVLTQVHWPCLMLGNLLVMRAGVSIEGGTSLFDAEIATSSTLYWAYRRKNRPHQDLSHGWGHNSQWRTTFRRDYCIGNKVYLNVDGSNDLGGKEIVSDDDNVLTREERVELLVNRSFIRTRKASYDLWPYNDKLRIDSGTPPEAAHT